MNTLKTLTTAVAFFAVIGSVHAQTTQTISQTQCSSGKLGTTCTTARQSTYIAPPPPPPKTAVELRTPSTSPREEFVRDSSGMSEAEKAAIRATRPGPKEVPVR